MTAFRHLFDQSVGGFGRSDVIDLHDGGVVAWLFADSGVVDQNVDTAESGSSQFGQLSTCAGDRQVDLDGLGSLQLACDAFEVDR